MNFRGQESGVRSQEKATRSRDRSFVIDEAQGLPRLRPMEIGELLDEAFELYRRNFGLLFGIAVLLNVPFSMLTAAFPQGSTGYWVASIGSGIPSLLTMGALAHAAMQRYLGQETTIIASYRQALRRFFPLLAGGIVYSLAAMGGFVLFIIPGIIVLLWALLLVPVVMVEGHGFGALGRSRELAQGQMWRLMVLGLGLFAVGMIVSFVFFALLGLAVALSGTTGSGPPTGPAGTGPTATLIQAGFLVGYALGYGAWMPLWTNAEVMLYIDLRIRREAYDLELLTRAVEARVETSHGERQAPGTAGAPASGPVGG